MHRDLYASSHHTPLSIRNTKGLFGSRPHFACVKFGKPRSQGSCLVQLFCCDRHESLLQSFSFSCSSFCSVAECGVWRRLWPPQDAWRATVVMAAVRVARLMMATNQAAPKCYRYLSKGKMLPLLN